MKCNKKFLKMLGFFFVLLFLQAKVWPQQEMQFKFMGIAVRAV